MHANDQADGNGKPIDVFTTTQVAMVLCCSIRTVSKAIDAGELTGFRLLGGKDRRVARGDLLAHVEGRPDRAACLDRIARLEAGKLTSAWAARKRLKLRREAAS